MTILEILEAHARFTDIGPVCGGKCTCGHDLDDDDRVMPWTLPDVRAAHRAHVAEVLEQHMRERERTAKAEVLEEIAAAYPVMLRDMVTRQSVAQWLRKRAAIYKESI